MFVSWIRVWTMPLLAMMALSACQAPPGYQRGYARQAAYAAAPSCGDYRYAQPVDCYQRPVRQASQPYCEQPYQHARSSYRYASASIPCATAYRPRGYRYVGERAASACAPAYRQRHLRYRPAYSDYRPARYRPARQYYSRAKSGSCCY